MIESNADSLLEYASNKLEDLADYMDSLNKFVRAHSLDEEIKMLESWQAHYAEWKTEQSRVKTTMSEPIKTQENLPISGAI